MTLYQLHGVSRAYGNGATVVNAVNEVHLDIDAGEFVAIVGPSGSGKTTMLQLLGALDRPTSGEVFFEREDMARMTDGEQAALRRGTLGFIFQQFNLIPTLSARQNVEAALAPTDVPAPERHRRAGELLPSQLSGGEQQRVAIARALANEPRVLLADEPTGNLDSATGEEFMALLQDLWRSSGLTIVLVTHDRSIAGAAPRLVRMRDGRVDGDGPAVALNDVEAEAV
jgi:ABC-type lipoprotein export system ATPase subunit